MEIPFPVPYALDAAKVARKYQGIHPYYQGANIGIVAVQIDEISHRWLKNWQRKSQFDAGPSQKFVQIDKKVG